MRVAATLLMVGVAASAPALTQTTAGPTFDVASVILNRSGDMRLRFGGDPGRYQIINAPLRTIIRVAFQVQDYQIVEAPDWIATERFDIVATTSAVAPAERAAMLRTLLADRFALRTHGERRDMPIFEMALTRVDGRLGPSARRTDVDCAAPARTFGTPGSAVGARVDRPPCGLIVRPGELIAGAMSMTEFARQLAPHVDRFVLDRTGIAGVYDFEVQFTPEQATLPPPDAAPLLPLKSDGGSLFNALREQLGVRLTATRASIEVLVIDRVNRPTPD